MARVPETRVARTRQHWSRVSSVAARLRRALRRRAPAELSSPPEPPPQRAVPEEAPVHTRFPLGHYYSPVYDPRELAAEPRRSQIWPPVPRETIGVDWRDEEQVALCTGVFAEQERLVFAEAETDDPTEYFALNDQFPPLDAWALEAILRHLRPRHMIEVGSGFSSLVTARVNREHLGGELDFVCIEPYPREFLVEGVPGISGLRVEKVQDTPLDVFSVLGEGDVLFIDTSHTIKTGGDVPWIYGEVLPRLASGVVVHIHDMPIPGDYPTQWVLDGWGWNERYLVQAFLAFSSAFHVYLSNPYMIQRHYDDLVRAFPGYSASSGRHGSSLWIRRG
jgi:hypothetical protein